MKRVIFCILIFAASSVFGMNPERQQLVKWGMDTLEKLDNSIQGFKQDVGPDGFTQAQRELVYLDTHRDKVKGDARSFVELIRFIIQTNPKYCADAPEQGGVSLLQQLLTFPIPDDNPEMGCAIERIKHKIKVKWVNCAAWWGSSEPRALEEKLRFNLMVGPRNTSSYGGGWSAKITQYVQKIDLDRFCSCEGLSLYQELEGLFERRELDDWEYEFLSNHPSIKSYFVREAQKEKEQREEQLVVQASPFLPTSLVSVVLAYSSTPSNCDRLRKQGMIPTWFTARPGYYPHSAPGYLYLAD